VPDRTDARRGADDGDGPGMDSILQIADRHLTSRFAASPGWWIPADFMIPE